jgi:hypothetical protein
LEIAWLNEPGDNMKSAVNSFNKYCTTNYYSNSTEI